MDFLHFLLPWLAVSPAALMLAAAVLPRLAVIPLWRGFSCLAVASLGCALASLAWQWGAGSSAAVTDLPGIATGPFAVLMAALVQLLGTVIGAFSSRYLQGERNQQRYVRALAAVLASVHVLLLADHWLLLIAAWAMVGTALQQLLCFYRERPFALLAAHKKRVADRIADALLIGAAALAWLEVGDGSLSRLWQHVAEYGASAPLQVAASCLVLAVILRTALLPVHGWLIQVMEAPTPVSALLHAGVVNLGGYVLIRFAPLLEVAPVARHLLVGFGLVTALLAGFVMLTRISIKVRLAWSTVAQMGFMILECGLGLYTLAALHLLGHSLYKAHAFLSASEAVRQTRLQMMRGDEHMQPASLLAAPIAALSIVMLVDAGVPGQAWPWWWSGVLALAWSPLLWLPRAAEGRATLPWPRAAAGLGMVAALTAAALLVHALPLGIPDAPDTPAGIVSLFGMALMYLALVTLRQRPRALEAWRRWSYAGFYVDEWYTRLTLRLWPTRWTPRAKRVDARPVRPITAAAAK